MALVVDVSQAVRNLSAQQVVRVRRDGAYNVDGVFVVSSTVSTPLRAVVQALTGRQRELLPEGVRTRARWRMHLADATVRVETQGSGEMADQVVYNGKTYTAIEDRDNPGHGRYQRVILAEAD
jgi:hypothetical protein